MAKNKVVHFEIPVSHFKKAKDFYENVFEWSVDMWGDEGAMVITTSVDKDQNPTEIGGINGDLYARKSDKDQPSIVIETDSIDDTLAEIIKAGGKVSKGKYSIGEWGSMADFHDPDGNEISLWEKGKK